VPELNPAYLTELYEAVATSPYPRLLGMRLTVMEPDRARIELEIGEHHLQPFGIVHGGVISTLIDTATFWAAFSRLPEDAGLVNVDLKLNYLAPAARGRLVADGRCLRPGRTLGYAEAYVRDDRGGLVAHGTSTLRVLPGKGLRLRSRKFKEPASP
jgi:uncharacterized protein (TIGR00369 family)